jgi:hypothetical protein
LKGKSTLEVLAIYVSIRVAFTLFLSGRPLIYGNMRISRAREPRRRGTPSGSQAPQPQPRLV